MRRLVLAALALAACSPPPEGPELKPHVDTPPTATEAAARETKTPADIAALMQGVALAEPEWLALAPTIAPDLNASQSADLSKALNMALRHNAPAALTAMQATGGADAVRCEPTFDPSTLTAVQSVSDPALQAIKARCLTFLEGDLHGADGG